MNGKDLSDATHEETVSTLNAAQEPIIVEVLRRPSHQITIQNTDQEQSSMNSVATQTDTSSMVTDIPCSNKMFVVPAPPPLNRYISSITLLCSLLFDH